MLREQPLRFPLVSIYRWQALFLFACLKMSDFSVFLKIYKFRLTVIFFRHTEDFKSFLTSLVVKKSNCFPAESNMSFLSLAAFTFFSLVMILFDICFITQHVISSSRVYLSEVKVLLFIFIGIVGLFESVVCHFLEILSHYPFNCCFYPFRPLLSAWNTN